MATTSIWRVKGRLDHSVNYVCDKEKTVTPSYESDIEVDGLEDILGYTTKAQKTEEQFFVTGINCSPESAVAEMNATKHLFGKPGGVIAYHGYQSFKPGEVSPEVAHEIGCKLAEELWGKGHEVVVSTHLDKVHLHNHFVVNTVSFLDGKRYYRSAKDYRQMRDISDRLCAEYGLSIVKDPAYGKAKHYGEWNAERQGKPTWRSIVKRDVDEAIEKAMTGRQFYQNLELLGYEIKTGKDISVRPPDKERFLRLARNFGDDYTYGGIKERILANKTPRLPVRKTRHAGHPPKKLAKLPKGSIIGLYRHYQYLFGHYRESISGSERMHFLLKEDLREFDAIIHEMELLETHSIETEEDLYARWQGLEAEAEALTQERKLLRSKDRKARISGPDKTPDPCIKEISIRLKVLRKEVSHCANIAKRSRVLKEKIQHMENQETQGQEERGNGRIRTGGRTDSAHDAFRQ